MTKKHKNPAIFSLSNEYEGVKKILLHKETKNTSLHDVRIFFKRLKSYVALANTLSGLELKLSKELRNYYSVAGDLRDAKILKKLCEVYLHPNKELSTFTEEKIEKAKETMMDFFAKHKAKKLVEDVDTVLHNLNKVTKSMDYKRVMSWLETFITHEEQMVVQLLQPLVISDVSLHAIRKKIKSMLFLLPYIADHNPSLYKITLKKYKRFAKKFGKRNDLNQLVQNLRVLQRAGDNKKDFEEILHLEEKKKEKMLKKIRSYLKVKPAAVSKITEWVNEEGGSANNTKTTKIWIENNTIAPIVEKTIKKASIKRVPVKKNIIKSVASENAVVVKKTTPTSKKIVAKKQADVSKKNSEPVVKKSTPKKVITQKNKKK